MVLYGFRDRRVTADGLGGVELETVGENGQSLEHPLFTSHQEVVGPRDCAREASMTLDSTASTVERLELAASKSIANLLQSERADPSGGQL